MNTRGDTMNNKGVTLIELIIVIVLIGIISAFTIPAVGRYVTTARKESVLNGALLIEETAETYCVEHSCSTGVVLTSSELSEYMSNIKSDYTYEATLLDTGNFSVTYYKEGEYSFPSNTSGELVLGMIPSIVGIDFVNQYGEGIVSNPDDGGDDFTVPEGEPYVRLVGATTVYVEYGGSYSEPGFNAFASDGSSISNKWNSGMGGTWSFGTTEITYSCYSSVDNKACIETKRYVVVVDTTPPEVHVNGSSTVYVSQGSSFTDYWGAWTYDKSNTASAVTSSSNVNTSVKGTYYVTYSSTDSSGNTGTSQRTVIVN